ncbi:MAG: type II toxin-antitoxin system VapC family toxin [Thermoplasmatota archaeon]
MKILVDSSTLYSAIAHSGKVSSVIELLIEEHTIVVTDYIVEELKRNIRKNVSKEREEEAVDLIEDLVSNCHVKKKEDYLKNLQRAEEKISKKDAPILACGMLPEIDYLVSSDKEFFEIETEEVSIFSPKEIDKMLL